MLQPYQVRHNPIKQNQGSPLLGTLGTVAGTAAGAAIGPAGAAIGGALGSQLGNVVSGKEIDPGQMAMTGMTSGMSAGTQAAGDAAKGLDAAKQSAVDAMAASGGDSAAYDAAIKKVQEAGMKSMEAQGSILNDPFGKAGKAAKSVFMADGGEVKTPLGQFDINKLSEMKSGDRDRMLMMGALPLIMQNPKMFGGLGTMMLSKGGEVKPKKKELKRDAEGNYILPADFDFSQLKKLSEADQQTRANLDQQSGNAKPVYKAYGGKAGPLCSSCEAEYKACGGMTKKRY